MRKWFLLVLVVVLVFTQTVQAVCAESTVQIEKSSSTIVFSDVTKSYEWARESIYYFAEQGVIEGVGGTKYNPGGTITREQFAKVLIMAFNAPLTSPDAATFSDVAKDRWSFPYIEVCKDFMTGFANPFGGKPSFHPNEAATREDIAVALVKIMGLTEEDLKDSYYLKEHFSDAKDISPGLSKFVGVAAERGLMQGYNGKFLPDKPITRAEAAVLLNRASKQAVSSMSNDLDITASFIEGEKANEITLSITAEEGTQVTVNGEKVRMDEVSDGYVGGMVLYTFEAEGTKSFIIAGVKGAKRKTFEKVTTYQIGAPVLLVTQCPDTSSTQKVTISGTVQDPSDKNPSVTVNGEAAAVESYFSPAHWSKTVTLAEGVNTFEIASVNSLGKRTVVTKTINFGVGAPVLTIIECPETASKKTVTISGTVKDTNDRNPVVTINGEAVSVETYFDPPRWSKSLTLAEGDNTYVISAVNKLGKKTTISRTINFNVGAPVLTITECPETSATKNITISGTVQDTNDSNPTVTINGSSVTVQNYLTPARWEKSVTLSEGANTVIIVAMNNLGKKTTISRTINFNVGAPVLTITECPEVSASSTITISGTVQDTNDSNPTVTINGSSVTVQNYLTPARWEKSVTLTEGTNTFTIVSTNRLGKKTTVIKSVVFTVAAPQITFTNCPEVTNQSNISLQGNVKDSNSNVQLYINDQEVSVFSYNGSFEKSVTLAEGDNTFVFRAVNSFGKSTTIAKTVKKAAINPPVLTVNDLPATTSVSSITVAGSVNDALDTAVVVYVNDKVVFTGNGSWSATVNLNEGTNNIITVATNKFGKSTTILKQIVYTPGAVGGP